MNNRQKQLAIAFLEGDYDTWNKQVSEQGATFLIDEIYIGCELALEFNRYESSKAL